MYNKLPLSKAFYLWKKCPRCLISTSQTLDMAHVPAFLDRSDSIFAPVKHPLPHHRAREMLGKAKLTPEKLEEMIVSARPIMTERVYEHLEGFLSTKRVVGSAVERSLYAEMGVDELISRLFRKRSAVFYLKFDNWMLRDGTVGSGGFDNVGANDETAPLLLSDVLSYDEIALSALIGLSSFSHFFNDGDRYNNGESGAENSFEPYGVIVGQVGARFERPCRMDWQHMTVTQSQNTLANGYGGAREEHGQSQLLQLWARLYNVPHLPLFDEADEAASGQSSDRFEFVTDGVYFDKEVFTERVRIWARTLLLEANARAAVVGKSAYVYVVGLGLGVWLLHPVQRTIFQHVFESMVETLPITHVGDVTFYCHDESHEESRVLPSGVRVHRLKRNPQARLPDSDQRLLVVNYAWDGNSWPGNEFYHGQLAASGDPAAAACSMISELHNADINSFVNGSNTVRY